MGAVQRFLETYEREHETTMRVLRAYPQDKADLRPHPKLKTAKELAFMFVMERGLGTAIFTKGMSAMTGKMPDPPATFAEVITQLEEAHKAFGDLVRSYSDEQFENDKVTFLVGPKTPGEYSRSGFAWFLLGDEIHHRGQFSIYLRLADGHVPSIYGPSGDEPWM